MVTYDDGENWDDPPSRLPSPPPRCPVCDRELIFDLTPVRGAISPYQVVPECEVHGALDVLDVPEVELTPNLTMASFPPPSVESERRPRGLRLGDIQAVVRSSKPPPRAAAS